MKAVVATRRGGPEVLELKEYPEPVPSDNEVLIRVVRAGVNFADVQSTQGTYAAAPPPPFVPGLEVSGHEVKSNRPVMALLKSGGYSEVVAADRRLVVPADGLDLQQAGGYPLVSLTAYYALHEVARLRDGETVLVVPGAGGLGSASIHTARALGAERVIAVASTEEKRKFALGQGADVAVSYDEPWPSVDVVIDAVGGQAFTRGFEAVRQLGRMVLLGMASGQPPEIPGFGKLRQRNVGILAFSFGALRSADPDLVARTAPAAIELIRAGKVRPPVGQTLPFAEAGEAHRLLTSRKSVGKILLAPSPD